MHKFPVVVNIFAMSATLSEPLLSVRAAAELLNVSSRTVYDLVARNEIPHARIGGQIRFVPEALEEWLRAGGRRAAP